ncbi:MAG: hypothetical protein QOI17_1117 [Gaiellales bacterium]|jgi:hypothetical protein|nr:hypothetical protein [Gaiellales bacterium]
MPTPITPEQTRRLAVDLFNQVWRMMERDDRTVDDDDRMLYAAHTSRWLWGEVGEPVNRARGEWQVSRVYTVLGRPEPALYHARRCLEICSEHGIGDFDLAYAHEALARAHALAGDRDRALASRRAAERAADQIADADDRELLDRDLGSLPA